MSLLNERTAALTPYVPGEQPQDGRSVIKLNTNECPYPPSPAAIRAVEGAAPALRLYPDPDAAAAREAFAALNGLSPKQVFAGNGSDEVLALAFQAFFGDGVLRFPAITYSFYPVFCRLYGIPFEAAAMANGLTVDVEALLAPCAGVVLANPNAPTGIALPLSQIERILRAHPDHVVLVDEAYVDFGGESALGLIGTYKNLLVVQTLSKSRALAGLRVGFAAGDEALIEGLDRVKNSFNSYPLDRLAIAGAAAALGDGDYFRETVRKIIATRERSAQALRALGFEVTDSRTNFLFVSHPRVPAAELYEFLRDRGILVRYFPAPPCDRYLRITVGTDAEMERLLAALRERCGNIPEGGERR